MDEFVIKGGTPLKGTIQVSGAKNAALPLMTASLLTSEPCTLKRIPNLKDVETMGKLLGHLGVTLTGQSTLQMTDGRLQDFDAPYDLVRTMRASILVLGPLVARHGRARVSLPGGCAIGARPIHLHLKALEAMGAEIFIERGYVNARAKKLHGARINFETVTVTGTENIVMAAALAKGTTRIENAAREPEVADLAAALAKMGAKIRGAGTDTIEIEGVETLRGFDHEVIPDRIEAGTFMIAAAITGGEVTVQGCDPTMMEALIHKLTETGTVVEKTAADAVWVKGPVQPKATNVTTAVYPGFATDFQAQFMALMTVADGTSVIHETIFENRFLHAEELARLGADITIEGNTAIVKGVPRLSGAPVMASDLRASAALVLAGLTAENTTRIRRVYHLDRGYDHLEVKLKSLGAKIERVSN